MFCDATSCGPVSATNGRQEPNRAPRLGDELAPWLDPLTIAVIERTAAPIDRLADPAGSEAVFSA
jgi:hypothetical protein